MYTVSHPAPGVSCCSSALIYRGKFLPATPFPTVLVEYSRRDRLVQSQIAILLGRDEGVLNAEFEVGTYQFLLRSVHPPIAILLGRDEGVLNAEVEELGIALCCALFILEL